MPWSGSSILTLWFWWNLLLCRIKCAANRSDKCWICACGQHLCCWTWNQSLMAIDSIWTLRWMAQYIQRRRQKEADSSSFKSLPWPGILLSAFILRILNLMRLESSSCRIYFYEIHRFCCYLYLNYWYFDYFRLNSLPSGTHRLKTSFSWTGIPMRLRPLTV